MQLLIDLIRENSTFLTASMSVIISLMLLIWLCLTLYKQITRLANLFISKGKSTIVGLFFALLIACLGYFGINAAFQSSTGYSLNIVVGAITGIIVVQITFSAENFWADVINGITIRANDSRFCVNCIVDIGGVRGQIKHIGWREIHIATHDRELEVIPYTAVTSADNLTLLSAIPAQKCELAMPVPKDLSHQEFVDLCSSVAKNYQKHHVDSIKSAAHATRLETEYVEAVRDESLTPDVNLRYNPKTENVWAYIEFFVEDGSETGGYETDLLIRIGNEVRNAKAEK